MHRCCCTDVEVIMPADFLAHSAPEFLDTLFSFSAINTISDVHFEPNERGLQVRFREDGLLFHYADTSKELSQSIIARLKVLAMLDLGEKRLPQDGEFYYVTAQKKKITLRVSTCPTLHGEKIVLRIHPETSSAYPLNQLGLLESQIIQLKNALCSPQGLILVVGPTGSGKSTTLYSSIAHINNHTRHIITAEDPIEVRMPGVTQVPIKPHLGFDFAAALRTFLRQDPDVMMIGEIRDDETASIALQAVQTGHLVLSTLHSQDCLASLSRLSLLQIDTALLADSLLLIVSQRLLRCIPKGRIGIFELLSPSAKIREQIRKKASLEDLRQQALKEGFRTLSDIAVQKMQEGIVSLEEIQRVLGGLLS